VRQVDPRPSNHSTNIKTSAHQLVLHGLPFVIGEFTNYGRGPKLLLVLVVIVVHVEKEVRTMACKDNLLGLAQIEKSILDLS